MNEQHLIALDRLSPAGTTFEGVVRPGELPNLAPDLANGDGELRFRVSAGLDRARRRIVSCKITGFVFLTCQTTFEVFRHEVEINDRLVLVGSEKELPPIERESEREDFVVVDSPLVVRDLVEESVILSLPMVPRKPGAEKAPETGPPRMKRASPFAALAGLKRTKSKPK